MKKFLTWQEYLEKFDSFQEAYENYYELYDELQRKDNIINAIKDFVKTETAQYYLSDDEKLESYGWEAQVILDKIKELEKVGVMNK